jgi:hypothetical protein
MLPFGLFIFYFPFLALTLTDTLPHSYIYSASNSRRDIAPANAHVAARHLRIAARAAEEAREEEEDAVHCDELCQLREGSTSKWANAQRVTAPANVTAAADDLD